jgi:DNA-binding transcriptional LysR family regulator
VAAFQTAARTLVVPAFASLARVHPRLECELSDQEAETALPRLLAGELDVVVAEEYEHAPRARHSRLARHELGRDELLVALPAGHRLARRRGRVAVAELAAEAWATPWTGTAYASMVARVCRAAGFEPDVRHRVTDLGTLLELARGGLAVSLVPSLGGAGEEHGLALRRLRDGGLWRSLHATVRRASEGRPAIELLLAELRARAAAPLSAA